MKLTKAIHEFAQHCVAGGKAKATVSAYESDLHVLARTTTHDTVFELTPEGLERHFRRLSEDGHAMSTLHRKTAAIREFVRWGAQQGLWRPELVAAIPRIRRPLALPRPFTRDEVGRLWALPLPADERVLRALLFFTGLRASAICAIRVGDLDQDPPRLWTITKGSVRVAKHMHPILAAEVLNYVLSATDLKPSSPLVSKAGGRPLTRMTLERITRRWGQAARVLTCQPHRFRHTFATELLEHGADIRVIQDLLDHRDIKSTTVYTKVTDPTRRAALLRLPASWGAPSSGGEEK